MFFKSLYISGQFSSWDSPPACILYRVASGALIRLLHCYIYILQTVSVNKME